MARRGHQPPERLPPKVRNASGKGRFHSKRVRKREREENGDAKAVAGGGESGQKAMGVIGAWGKQGDAIQSMHGESFSLGWTESRHHWDERRQDITGMRAFRLTAATSIIHRSANETQRKQPRE
eukprot:2672830-Rhodomonas_salina.1